MKVFHTLLLIVFTSIFNVYSVSLPEQLQDISVTVIAKGGQGSGVIKVRDGVSYVWTAGHVVSANRQTRSVIDSESNSIKSIVTFDDVMVVRDIIENGRLVGSVMGFAQIIKYSDVNFGADLALLRLYKQNFSSYSANFCLDSNIPLVGESLIHVGSMRGHFGANSYTTGVVSQHGRILNGKLFDQVSTTAQPGSSGCGIFTKDGKYVGMLVRGCVGADTFNFITPIRVIIEWAKNHGVYWAIDDSVPVDFSNSVIEDYREAAPIYVKPDSSEYDFPLLINKKLHQ